MQATAPKLVKEVEKEEQGVETFPLQQSPPQADLAKFRALGKNGSVETVPGRRMRIQTLIQTKLFSQP